MSFRIPEHPKPTLPELTIEADSKDPTGETKNVLDEDSPLVNVIYLSSTRLVQTPKEKSTNFSETNLRRFISLSPGGMGTTTPNFLKTKSAISRGMFLKAREASEKCFNCSGKIELNICIHCKTKICGSCSLRMMNFDRNEKTYICHSCRYDMKLQVCCTRCGADHSNYSRACVKCTRMFCRSCKSKSMRKLARKTWICKQCDERISKEPAQPNCLHCGGPYSIDKRARACVLCNRGFCKICKKVKMKKIGHRLWVCGVCG